MISINDIYLSFGSQLLFDHISGSIGEDDRVGLVGLNGAGKSTLLKVLAGHQNLDGGSISLPKSKQIVYLPQDIVLISSESVLVETLSIFQSMNKLLAEKKILEQELKKNQSGEIVERYAVICQQLQEEDYPAKEAEAKKILIGLGFNQDKIVAPVDELSGGWKMRVVLAKMLLQKADFYLFDEPTNHLDIVAKDWFLSFLQQASFGFIMVCHERHVLNKLCNKILELEWGKAKVYKGSYTQYEQQKELDIVAQQHAYEQQQRDIKEKLDTINRFKAKATKASLAKSMLKKVEKIERLHPPISSKSIHFSFDEPIRPGRIILKATDVAHQYNAAPLFEKVTFQVERGEKVALIAPNGVGKTTLFNLISGKLKLQRGSIEYGPQVKHAIYEQEQDNWLNPQATILENLVQQARFSSEQKIRSLAGSFLFSGDDINKRAAVLSGGEKSRTGMIRLLLQGAHFLLLDEPTNHLDIISKDILLKALKSYQGTLLFVSHDHDFINNLATRVLELNKNGITSFPGNYEAFLFAKEQMQSLQNSTCQKTPEMPKKLPADERIKRKKLSALEKKVDRLEAAKRELEKEFECAIYGTVEYYELEKRFSAIQQEIAKELKEWEILHEQC